MFSIVTDKEQCCAKTFLVSQTPLCVHQRHSEPSAFLLNIIRRFCLCLGRLQQELYQHCCWQWVAVCVSTYKGKSARWMAVKHDKQYCNFINFRWSMVLPKLKIHLNIEKSTLNAWLLLHPPTPKFNQDWMLRDCFQPNFCPLKFCKPAVLPTIMQRILQQQEASLISWSLQSLIAEEEKKRSIMSQSSCFNCRALPLALNQHLPSSPPW